MDFRRIEPGETVAAYHWHSGFAAANQNLLPRTEAQFQQFIADGQVWAAVDERKFAGFAYCVPDLDSTGRVQWELGGLMVAAREKGLGIGSTLARLVLLDLLATEDPFRRGERIISHVLVSNQEPRTLIERVLRFTHRDRRPYPGSALPGLPTDEDGNVWGDTFELREPAALVSLRNWCTNVPTNLRDERPVNITLTPRFTFEQLASMVAAMIATFIPAP